MKKLFMLIALFAATTLVAQDITGMWNGLLKFPGAHIRITVEVIKTETGYTAMLGSPDQGDGSTPADTFSFENDVFAFTFKAAGAEYKGTYENGIIKGTFVQSGYSIPTDLTREEVKTSKPQEPIKPYPYYTEDVTFRNEGAGITLAGTLTLPKKEGNYPVVILISGSGQQNRDEEAMGHKPFLVLADHLTKNGIAVFRYDDRGAGKSGGNPINATTADFATDTEAALAYLRTRPEINKKKIGLTGHSEGGMIAPMVAEKNPDVAFIVMLAGPGITGAEQMVLQNYLVGKADGLPESELTQLTATNKKLYDAITSESDVKTMKKNAANILNSEMGAFFVSKGVPQSEVTNYINAQIEVLTSPWYVYFLKFNPAQYLEKIKCPILALNGDKDVQVAANANLDGIKRAAEKAGNKKVTTKKLPGLNHLFQECKTCTVAEYAEIEQTFSPAALNEISGWITTVVK